MRQIFEKLCLETRVFFYIRKLILTEFITSSPMCFTNVYTIVQLGLVCLNSIGETNLLNYRFVRIRCSKFKDAVIDSTFFLLLDSLVRFVRIQK